MLTRPFDLFAFRPTVRDLPIIVWCTWPFLSSFTNGLGAYDGVSEVFYRSVSWGAPYLFGRLYFDTYAKLREAAVAIVVAGLLYVPLCVWEIRMSPDLHYRVFGKLQHSFYQTVRGSYYRPMVFMDHGLMLALWMGVCSTAAFVLWRTRALNEVLGIRMGFLCGVLVATTIACQSYGVVALLPFTLLVFAYAYETRQRWPILALACVPYGYAALRVAGSTSTQVLVSLVEPMSETRAYSLDYRLAAEQLVVRSVDSSPLFGHGGFGRGNVTDRDGRRVVAKDGLWVSALSRNGYVGLLALLTLVTLPVFSLMRRLPTTFWGDPRAGPPLALASVLCLFGLDLLFNNFPTSVYMLAAGALTAAPVLRARVVKQAALPPSLRRRLAAIRSGG